MTPEQLAGHAADVLGGDCPATVAFGQVTVDVPPHRWVRSAAAVRDDPQLQLTYFDLLVGVDELPADLTVVVHLWSVAHRHGLLLRTAVARQEPSLPTLTGLFAGAAWHERQAAEMFGIAFDDHPSPGPLLLPRGFEGHPLRKEFLLEARQDKPWPGAVDPADSGDGPRRSRRPLLPPGVVPR